MKKLWINDILETQRCILKVPEESDAEDIWNLVTENIQKYLIRENYESIKHSKQETNTWHLWDAAILDKKTQKYIWRISISYVCEKVKSIELWYWLSEEYWGEGIVVECIKRIKNFSFESANYEKIIIRCDSDNIQSIRVAEKCWFQQEWILRKDHYARWACIDRCYFWLLREEYLWKN